MTELKKKSSGKKRLLGLLEKRIERARIERIRIERSRIKPQKTESVHSCSSQDGEVILYIQRLLNSKR